MFIEDVPQWLTEFQSILERWSAVLFMENISRAQREAIKSRKLSLLEFRCYLFSRQASLLMAASKPWNVKWFIFLYFIYFHTSTVILYYILGGRKGINVSSSGSK